MKKLQMLSIAFLLGITAENVQAMEGSHQSVEYKAQDYEAVNNKVQELQKANSRLSDLQAHQELLQRYQQQGNKGFDQSVKNRTLITLDRINTLKNKQQNLSSDSIDMNFATKPTSDSKLPLNETPAVSKNNQAINNLNLDNPQLTKNIQKLYKNHKELYSLNQYNLESGIYGPEAINFKISIIDEMIPEAQNIKLSDARIIDLYEQARASANKSTNWLTQYTNNFNSAKFNAWKEQVIKIIKDLQDNPNSHPEPAYTDAITGQNLVLSLTRVDSNSRAQKSASNRDAQQIAALKATIKSANVVWPDVISIINNAKTMDEVNQQFTDLIMRTEDPRVIIYIGRLAEHNSQLSYLASHAYDVLDITKQSGLSGNKISNLKDLRSYFIDYLQNRERDVDTKNIINLYDNAIAKLEMQQKSMPTSSQATNLDSRNYFSETPESSEVLDIIKNSSSSEDLINSLTTLIENTTNPQVAKDLIKLNYLQFFQSPIYEIAKEKFFILPAIQDKTTTIQEKINYLKVREKSASDRKQPYYVIKLYTDAIAKLEITSPKDRLASDIQTLKNKNSQEKNIRTSISILMKQGSLNIRTLKSTISEYFKTAGVKDPQGNAAKEITKNAIKNQSKDPNDQVATANWINRWIVQPMSDFIAKARGNSKPVTTGEKLSLTPAESNARADIIAAKNPNQQLYIYTIKLDSAPTLNSDGSTTYTANMRNNKVIVTVNKNDIITYADVVSPQQTPVTAQPAQ